MISSIRPHSLLDHHDVVHPDGVGEGELEAGEDVGQRGLGGQAGDEGDDAGGGQDAGAGGPGGGNVSSIAAAAQDADHHDGEPAQQGDLGAHPAGVPVVGDVHVVARQRQVGRREHGDRHEPADGADQREPQQPRHRLLPAAGPGHGIEDGDERGQHQQRAQRGAAAAGDVRRPPASAGPGGRPAADATPASQASPAAAASRRDLPGLGGHQGVDLHRGGGRVGTDGEDLRNSGIAPFRAAAARRAAARRFGEFGGASAPGLGNPLRRGRPPRRTGAPRHARCCSPDLSPEDTCTASHPGLTGRLSAPKVPARGQV